MALTLSSFTGCSCDEGGIVGGTSSIELSTAAIDFGRVFVGSSAERILTLRTSGDLPVAYGMRFDGSGFGFFAAPAVSSLGPNQTIEVTVGFRPGVAGPAEAAVIIENDSTQSGPLRLQLIGIGVDPPDCEDGNGCTVDTFDPVSGRCEHRAEPVPCNDFNACTVGDTCAEGLCLGESASCDDQDPCTDDFCDPTSGCVHDRTRSCDDANPCTTDFCDQSAGCSHLDLDDGTPCDDFDVCTTGDICFGGACIGVTVPDGIECNDGDPCSKNDQCIAGECRDPDYTPPAPGELKFVTAVGPLAPGGGDNPIIDRAGTTYVGLTGGAAAVDVCGETLWTNLTLGTPVWGAAASLPGLLVVPIGPAVVDVDQATGEVRRRLDLAAVFGPLPAGSSTTATAAVAIHDLAVRGSGALVVSASRTTRDGAEVREEGLLIEVDRSHSVATAFRILGPEVASRLAIDRDESVIAVLSARGDRGQRLVRFGLEGLPAGTWSTAGTGTTSSEVALGPEGQVVWSRGPITVTARGELDRLLAPASPRPHHASAPVFQDVDRICWARPVDEPLPGPSFAPAVPYELVSIDLAPTATTGQVRWQRPLAASAEASSPAVDAAGNVFLVTRDGDLLGVDPDGTPILDAPLPVDPRNIDRVSLAVSAEQVIIVATDGKVIGVQWATTLGRTSWPRRRGDNLSTGHR